MCQSLFCGDCESSGDSNTAPAASDLARFAVAVTGADQDRQTAWTRETDSAGRSAAEPVRLIRRISGFFIDWTDEPGRQSGVRNGAVKPISIY